VKIRSKFITGYYIFLLATSVLYIFLTLLAPLGPNRFNLTPYRTHQLQLSIALPVILIWAIAVYGAAKFAAYSYSIKKYRDGNAMKNISAGVSVLVLSSVFNSCLGALRPWAARCGWIEWYTVLTNYMAIVFPLFAFYLIHKGSRQLLSLIKKEKSQSNIRRWVVIIPLFLFSVLYVIALFHYRYRNSTPDPYAYSSFYLPDAAILVTIAVPYIVAWGLGLWSCLNIYEYRKKVNGSIYRTALNRLALGVFAVIIFSMMMQFLVAFSTYFASYGLGSILLLVYLIILLYALGYIVIASGVKNLLMIEDVKP